MGAGGDANVVRILVTSDDEASAGFGTVTASAEDMAAKTSAALAEYQAAMEEVTAAQGALADSAARLAEVQADESASAEDVAAAEEAYAGALDKSSAAVAASLDARTRLIEAEQAQAEAATAAASATADGAETAAAAIDTQTAAQARLTAEQRANAAAVAEQKAALAGLITINEQVATGASVSADEQAAALKRVEKADAAVVATSQKAAAAQAEVAAASEEASGAEVEAATGMASGMKGASLTTAAAIAAIGYEAIKMSTSFQSSMQLLVTQAGVPKSALAGLKQGVLDLAGQVGFSPDSLSQALFHVESSFASVGISGPKAMSLLKIAAEGAATGHADLTDVTNALDSTIVAGVPGITSYSQAMGALNAVVGSGDMTMQDLASAMGSGVMAVAKSYGQNIYQVGAALAVFGDNNIRGAKAATDLRMAWQAVQAPLTTAGPILKSIGLTSTTLASTMEHHGLSAAITQFVGHLKSSKVPASDWGQYMTEIFGKKAGVGIGILTDQLGRLNSKFPDIKKGASGFASAWQATQATLGQKLKDLRGSFDSVMVAIGERLLPVVTKFAGILESDVLPVIGKVASWLDHNKPVLIAIAAGIAAVLVPAFIAWAVAAGSAALATLAAAAPLILIAAVVAAVVLGIIELVKHWHDVAAVAKKVWHEVLSIIDAAWREIKKIIAPFISWWHQNGQEIIEIWNSVWGPVKTIFTAFWHFLVTVAKDGWQTFMDILRPGLDLLTSIFRVAWAIISGVFKTAWDIIAAVVKVAIHAVVMIVKTAWDILVGIFDVALDLITGHWGKAWTDVKTTVTQVLNNVKDFLTSTWHDIADLVEQALNIIKGVFSSAWNAIKGGVTSAFGDIVGFFSGLPHRILSALGDLGSMLYDAGQRIIQGLANGIKDAVHFVTAPMSDIASEIKSFLPFSPAKKGPLSGSGAPEVSGRRIAQMLGQGMTSGLGSVSAAASKMAGAAVTGASGGTGNVPGGGGWMELRATGTGAANILSLVKLAWPSVQLEVRSRGGGGPNSVQKALGRTWPAGA